MYVSRCQEGKPYKKCAHWIFAQVSLDVRGKQTLEESLDFYVQGELMEGDNQYLCEELGKKVDPPTPPPPLLVCPSHMPSAYAQPPF